ncbi:MAG: Ig-like domain-containing protein [Oscillospiraceae bacterium]|jgi:uncharacterized protein YjdB|nr:Ig-like domain-containing protein [Oscillospiraceae bacterium]
MKKRLLALALALTLAASLSVVAGAESIMKTAKKTITLSKNTTYDVGGGKLLDLKVVVPKSGNLTFNYEVEAKEFVLAVYDSNGTFITETKLEATAGAIVSSSAWYTAIDQSVLREAYGTNMIYGIKATWNTVSEKAAGAITYKLDKGTYYVRIGRSSAGLSSVKLNAVLKDSDGNVIKSADAAVKSVYVTIPVAIGKSVALTATTDPTGEAATWKSSDAKVASVSSSGKVTGVAKGTAKITVTSGEKSQTVYVKVS